MPRSKGSAESGDVGARLRTWKVANDALIAWHRRADAAKPQCEAARGRRGPLPGRGACSRVVPGPQHRLRPTAPGGGGARTSSTRFPGRSRCPRSHSAQCWMRTSPRSSASASGGSPSLPATAATSSIWGATTAHADKGTETRLIAHPDYEGYLEAMFAGARAASTVSASQLVRRGLRLSLLRARVAAARR